MVDQLHERSWLEPLKLPPLSGRGFDDRLRDRIMRELETGRIRSADKRRASPVIALLAGFAALFAVLLVKPGTEPVEQLEKEVAAAQADTKIEQTMRTPLDHEWADGLLLGLRTDRPAADDGMVGRYRTLWIAPDEGGPPRLLAEGSGILVPYGMDFWLVDDANFVSGEQLFARKISSVRPSASLSQPLTLRDTDDNNAELREILAFAGQSYTVLYRSGGEGGRESLLTDLNSLSAGERNSLALDEISPLTQEEAAEAGSDWSVVREQGRWIIHTENVAVPLNDRASVHDGVCLPWTDILEAVPNAVDAFCSPGESWMTVLTDKTIAALPVYEDGTLGGPVLMLPLHQEETPVLAEWATGAYVEKWTSFIATLYGADGEDGS